MSVLTHRVAAAVGLKTRMPSWDGATPQRLRLTRMALLLATILVGLVGVVLADGALQSVEQLDTRTSRALIATRQAHAALTDADRVVVHSFLSGDVLLGGPGQRYQDAIKTANQSIEQLAEAVGSESADSRKLQSIDAELVTYIGLVEQADAAHRAEKATAGSAAAETAGLGEAYLWYGSRMLHEPGSGLLARIDQLSAEQQQTLNAGRWWLGAGALWTYLVVAVLLLGGLAVAQIWMVRRFRRWVSLPLALATACALAVCAWTAVDLVHVQRTYASAEQDGLRPLLERWRVRSAAADTEGQSALGTLLVARCPAKAACQSTITDLGASISVAARQAREASAKLTFSPDSLFSRSLAASERVGTDVIRRDLVAARRDVQAAEPAFSRFDTEQLSRIQAEQKVLSRKMQSAQEAPGLRIGIPILAVAIVILTFLGFGPRLNEY